MLSCYKNNAFLLKPSLNYQKITFIIPKLLTWSFGTSVDPAPYLIIFPLPRYTAVLRIRIHIKLKGMIRFLIKVISWIWIRILVNLQMTKAKIMEYELILALFPGFKPFFVSYLQIDKQVLNPHLSDADRQHCYTDNLFIFRTFLIYDFRISCTIGPSYFTLILTPLSALFTI